jgi:hypothetical protein
MGSRIAAIIGLLISTVANAAVHEADVCVFGGTSAGVIAAVQVAQMGRTTVLVAPERHLGGLTSGGLGWTDIGNKAAIGGLSRQFYRRLGEHYGKDEAWTFEPHVAEAAFEALIAEAHVSVFREQRLAGVKKVDGRIVELTTDGGDVFRARMFIDATYEGDLMARAGVSYFVGREANATYGESLDGIRAATPKHQFEVPVDPFVKAGDPASGLLPFVQDVPFGSPGGGDRCVQAYNLRLCLTRVSANQWPIEPPPNYDAARYELLGRYFDALGAAGKKPALKNFLKIDLVTLEKTDINNNGAFSTDFIGGSYRWPEASDAERAEIYRDHLEYVQGLLFYLANSSRVPEPVRTEMQQWGPCRDEFTDNHGWPLQLYVREARRMVADYVMSEKNCRRVDVVPDAIALAAYNMDSHNARRLVRDGHVENEGDVQVAPMSPYPIAYRAIVPRAAECTNLLVPVCLSASHIAYGSIRMEPVFVILGQSAATAAVLAIAGSVPIQRVDYPALRARLIADHQVLEWVPPPKTKRPVPTNAEKR